MKKIGRKVKKEEKDRREGTKRRNIYRTYPEARRWYYRRVERIRVNSIRVQET